MQTENLGKDVPQQDNETRKPWQTPTVEVLLVEDSESSFGPSGPDGPFTS